jgi:twitching motility protein PilT
MTQKKPPLIGRLAVQLKLINMDQLNQATAEQGRNGDKRLADIFVELGFINQKQLQKLASIQQDLIAKHRAKQARAGAAAPAATSAPSPIVRSKEEVLAAATRAAQDASPTTTEHVAELAQPAAPVPPAAVAAAPALPEPAQLSEPAAVAPAGAVPPAAQVPPAPLQGPVESDDRPASLGLVLPEADASHRQQLEQILGSAIAAGASDVHLHSGDSSKLRLNGELVSQGETMSREVVESLVSASLSAEQRAELVRDGEIDFCFEMPGVGRFRANAYRQQRGFDVVYRSIPAQPPSLDELGLPHELAKYTNYHQGMVLITGPAGCGKSATLAAMVNLINEERNEHILSIEDPIEVLHPPKRCLVNQRHAGRHTSSFARALRGALREDPDVIVIGELRDLETISLAMTAAETGHFVLATLHTNNAVRTVNRIIGAFPSNEQGQVRTMLSESLRAVISQRLVPTADGRSRVPALELLVINRAIGNLIRDEKTVQIRSAIQTGKAHGMYLLEQSLNDLVAAGTITREKALELAEEDKLITAGR